MPQEKRTSTRLTNASSTSTVRAFPYPRESYILTRLSLLIAQDRARQSTSGVETSGVEGSQRRALANEGWQRQRQPKQSSSNWQRCEGQDRLQEVTCSTNW